MWDVVSCGPAFYVLWLLMLLALLFRLPHLAGKSLWLDEISSLTFAEMKWPEFWSLVKRHEGNMLAYRPDGARLANLFCDITVGASFAIRDTEKSAPHLFLKLRAGMVRVNESRHDGRAGDSLM